MSHLVYITLFSETDGVTLSRLECDAKGTTGPHIALVQKWVMLCLRIQITFLMKHPCFEDLNIACKFEVQFLELTPTKWIH